MSRHLHPGMNIGGADRKAHAEAEPVMFGFWIFLMSDLVLFAVLFATYASMSRAGLAGGPAPQGVVELKSAAVQTALLLTSSFTFGLASLALKYRRDTGRLLFWLGVSALLGAAFLALEVRDFASLSAAGKVPQRSGFLSAYWTLLGVHGAHVMAGILWAGIMAIQLQMFGISGAVRLRVMRLALFWHMLDIVWVAIFTFVFLFGSLA